MLGRKFSGLLGIAIFDGFKDLPVFFDSFNGTTRSMKRKTASALDLIMEIREHRTKRAIAGSLIYKLMKIGIEFPDLVAVIFLYVELLQLYHLLKSNKLVFCDPGCCQF